jgi:hypothetical protein
MSTESKPSDPYTAKAKDEVPLKEKVEEFTTFIKTCKFGMMTTRVAESGQLTSRAMALAATVCSVKSVLYFSFFLCTDK